MSLPDMREMLKACGDMPIRFALSRFWPGSDGDDEDMSAMDCAIVTVRMIFSHLGNLGRTLAQTECALGNEFLKFAMSDFTAETEEFGKAVVQEAREKMFATIKRDWGLKEPITFAKLMESDPMVGALWGLDDFILFHPIMTQKDEGAEWKWMETGEPEGVLEARRSLVEWTTDQGSLSPADATDNMFGTKVDIHNVKYQVDSNSPVVLRMVLESSRQMDDFGMANVQMVKLPKVVRTFKRHLGQPEVQVQNTYPEGGSTYTLMAAVKLRGEAPGQHDCIRLFQLAASVEEVVPGGEPARRRGFVDPHWSFNEKGKYMLYYIRQDHVSRDFRPQVYRGTVEEQQADEVLLRDLGRGAAARAAQREQELLVPRQARVSESSGLILEWSDAREEAGQSQVDLRQSQVDVRQSQVDVRQAQVDVRQAQVDITQASASAIDWGNPRTPSWEGPRGRSWKARDVVEETPPHEMTVEPAQEVQGTEQEYTCKSKRKPNRIQSARSGSRSRARMPSEELPDGGSVFND